MVSIKKSIDIVRSIDFKKYLSKYFSKKVLILFLRQNSARKNYLEMNTTSATQFSVLSPWQAIKTSLVFGLFMFKM